MATRLFTRFLLTTKQNLSSVFSRSYASLSLSTPSSSLSTSSILRFRPLVAVAAHFHRLSPAATTIRGYATRQTSSSLNDPNPNWSNRPPKETILLDGCDFEHWLVVMEKPEGDLTRDEIIDSYIKTLATVVGSEDEARMKIYSVSTRHYFAFGALVSEELSYKLKELPKVRWVLPDSYLDVRNKDYGGEPFINGQAVPYDPKYHEEWVRNNARANERNRRNDRPRNFDRSRNFERRRENTQNQGFQMNQGSPNPAPNMGPMPPNNMGGQPHMGQPPSSNMGYQPRTGGMQPSNMGGQPHMGGPPPSNMGGQPHMGGPPPSNMGGQPHTGGPPLSNMGGGMQYNNMGGQTHAGGMHPNNMMPNNMGQMPPNNGGFPSNNPTGAPNNAPNFQHGGVPSNGGPPFQNGEMPGPQQNRGYQQNYAPNTSGGNPYQPQNVPGRDMPPPQNYQ